MRILFASGGTGGHIYPGLTLAKELLARGEHEVLFVGTKRGLEGELVRREGYPLRFIQSAPLTGGLLKKGASLFQITRGVFEAKRLLSEFKPHVVVGTGGYACGPVVLAAHFAKVPVLLQEQNALPGKTNKILSRFAQIVAVGYEESRKYFPERVQGKLIHTGNPIRREIIEAEPKPRGKTRILLLGASQGARRLNQAAVSLYELAGQGRIELLHQSGPKLFGEARGQLEKAARSMGGEVKEQGDGVAWRGVQLYPYLYDMPKAYSEADLVITRCGAISLAEITALGLPAILVPYPHAAGDHQTYNARALADRGAGILIKDEELTPQRLAQEVAKLLDSPDVLSQMAAKSRQLGKRGATDQIVDLILSLA
ncbi:MAG: undecaprenyldiphospho-muramoylpentapeptide beta-N-acetylglucosaminyltransferase [Firmicutes bacterium]|jgi:UDP-N-acetylglucosamine--N-acetylmuramyl-(pentapeptide) pyrophosphoryl-undecaprenol N-acetylglucosamine transferase|nr:undecaprenyldiphospho-muramoylpentapeptide beta-N-acetylglucosaminyltransferase [Bacillota bacterium]HOB22567.1 undecaprenyldiphospho-muramoylpentapeptide beta-N-acetylglucosaminyltransferase [Bacillota bacterium]